MQLKKKPKILDLFIGDFLLQLVGFSDYKVSKSVASK